MLFRSLMPHPSCIHLCFTLRLPSPPPCGLLPCLSPLRGRGHELSQAPGECPHPGAWRYPSRNRECWTGDIIMPAGNEVTRGGGRALTPPSVPGEPKLTSAGLCPGSSRLHSNGQGWGRRACGAHTELTLWPGVSLSFLQMLLAVMRLGQNKTLGGLQKMID